ncbi:MAG: hypothetical protein MUC57_11900 [Desulfobacterales bacterium]|nr:hypothetical protein [Desulfobacterales bacterium]
MKGYGPEAQAAATSISDDAWVKRSGVERRSGADKRRRAHRVYFLEGGRERRRADDDRRQNGERRDGWLQIEKWRSICVFDSKK